MMLHHLRNFQSVCPCLSQDSLFPYKLFRWLIGTDQDTWFECVLDWLALLFLFLCIIESDPWRLHLPGFLVSGALVGFGQWEGVVGDRRAGGRRTQDISPISILTVSPQVAASLQPLQDRPGVVAIPTGSPSFCASRLGLVAASHCC